MTGYAGPGARETEYRLTIAAMALRATCSGIINTRSHSESKEVKEDYDDLLSTLALAYHAISNSQYPSRGTRGSAGRLPIEEAIAEYLRYPDRSFLVDFRMHRESFVGCSD